MPRFLYGTSGWSYKDWVGSFYPEGTKQGDFLQVYAGKYPAVEVDSTYYRTPSPQMTTNWARRTPRGFLFSPKMVRDVTHDKFLKDCDAIVKQYLFCVSKLGKKLGPIVLQFPYFKKKDGVTLDVFLERLDPFLASLPEGYRFAVETRNKTFLKPALIEILITHQVPLVLIDHPWMPKPEEYLKIEGAMEITDLLPIRLLGDRYKIEKTTKTWEKEVEDKSERLQQWAKVIQHALSSGLDVQAFINNHFAGHAPATLMKLLQILDVEPRSAS